MGVTSTLNRTNSGLFSAASFNLTLMPTLGGSGSQRGTLIHCMKPKEK